MMSPVILGMTSPIHHDGSEVVEFPYVSNEFSPESNTQITSLLQFAGGAAFGNMDGDEIVDVVMPGLGANWLYSLVMRTEFDYQHGVLAWSGADGRVLQGWPRQIEDLQFLSSPAIADISGDGMSEAPTMRTAGIPFSV